MTHKLHESEQHVTRPQVYRRIISMAFASASGTVCFLSGSGRARAQQHGVAQKLQQQQRTKHRTCNNYWVNSCLKDLKVTKLQDYLKKTPSGLCSWSAYIFAAMYLHGNLFVPCVSAIYLHGQLGSPIRTGSQVR